MMWSICLALTVKVISQWYEWFHRFWIFWYLFCSFKQYFFKVIKLSVENEKLIQEYETLSSVLLLWIRETIEKLSTHDFGNTFIALQQQMADFNLYRTKEKPQKWVITISILEIIFEYFVSMPDSFNIVKRSCSFHSMCSTKPSFRPLLLIC